MSLAALLLPACLAFQAPADDAFDAAPGAATERAVQDELQRSIERLRMEGVESPYLLAFRIRRDASFSCSAVFGALASRAASESHVLALDLRVGDYALDNSNFGRSRALGGRGYRVALPAEDDYEAARQRAWLVADRAYKAAVEDLAAKRAWLQSNLVPDRPDDLARAEPNVHLGATPKLALDLAPYEDLTGTLSALFRETPAIQASRIYFDAGVGSETLLSSEGFHTRKGYRFSRLIAIAATQAEDGMPLGDAVVHYVAAPEQLPDAAVLEDEVEAMAARLTERVSAPRAEEYIGPVLFEGDAACFVILELLIDRLSHPEEPLGAQDAGTPYKNRLNRRVAPDFLTVVDDPLRTEHDGRPLLGSFAVDDDGVPAQPVTLVQDGRLEAWYMSRVPTRAIAETNGHSVGGSGGPGCVFVQSSQTRDADALRAELLRLAADQELEYGIVVRSLARADVGVNGARANGSYRNGTIALSPPVAAWRVYLDGREEPIRGGEWQGVTLRTLRDLYATGDRAHVLNTFRNGALVSVVCPPLLVEELEMKKPEPHEEKLPYLPHPFFAAE